MKVIFFIYSGPKLILLYTLWIGLMAKLSSDINMHAYTNYTSYDKKNFLYMSTV